jgi:predicted secreted acid phosphatase
MSASEEPKGKSKFGSDYILAPYSQYNEFIAEIFLAWLKYIIQSSQSNNFDSKQFDKDRVET